MAATLMLYSMQAPLKEPYASAKITQHIFDNVYVLVDQIPAPMRIYKNIHVMSFPASLYHPVPECAEILSFLQRINQIATITPPSLAYKEETPAVSSKMTSFTLIRSRIAFFTISPRARQLQCVTPSTFVSGSSTFCTM